LIGIKQNHKALNLEKAAAFRPPFLVIKVGFPAALKELRLHLGLEDQPHGVLVEKLASPASVGGAK
jgi:hypothetical protein